MHTMRAAVYLRQSLDRDGSGAAIDRQREDCLKLAAERGWDVVHEYVDNDVSASSRKPRPAYTQLLEATAEGSVDVIVAWHLDRLTRKLTELEHLIDLAQTHGVRVATVTGDLDLSTDAGRLVGRILASVARGEVERKGSRQRRAQQQAATLGRPHGGRRSFGYARDGATVREAEAADVREAYRTVLAGGSLSGIAADWNARRVTTTMGNAWTHSVLRRLLLNPRNAALRTYRGEIVGPGSWDPLVPEDTWHAARGILTEPSRRTTTMPPARLYLLPGLALCHCGATVTTGRTQHGVRTYRCRERKGHMSRAAEPIDDLVTRTVIARLERPDARALLTSSQAVDADAQRERAQSIRGRLSELTTALADGVLPLADVRRQSERLRGELEAVEAQVRDLERGDVLADLVGSADVTATWDVLTLDRRRAVIDVLMTVTLLAPLRGRQAFDPDTVRIEWKAST